MPIFGVHNHSIFNWIPSMTEQDKMFIALSEYNIGLQTYEGNFVVSLKYPDSWAVIEPSEKNIRFMRDGEQKGVYYYIVPTTDGENGLNGVFRVVNETVMYNKELQEKVELLNAKIKELQDIFVENPISELRKLEFVFKGKKKKTAKRSKVEKTSEEVVEAEEVNDTDKLIAESIMRKNNSEDTSAC